MEEDRTRWQLMSILELADHGFMILESQLQLSSVSAIQKQLQLCLREY